MKGYVYVERSRLASVLSHGYLSARAQHELLGVPPPAAKYARQMAAARAAYPELSALLAPLRGRAEQTLAYLDWRDERTLKGSRAVYFLYAPVPADADVRDFVRRCRGDFLKGRVLLELDVRGGRAGGGAEVTPVGQPMSPASAARRSAAWWLALWRALARPARNAASCEPQLWFEGVPHGYVVPRSGRIPPSRIRVLAG
jgi:hypothetical protein